VTLTLRGIFPPALDISKFSHIEKKNANSKNLNDNYKRYSFLVGMPKARANSRRSLLPALCFIQPLDSKMIAA